MGLRTIGQLAKDSGIPVDTIRYYERIGLLPRRLAAGTGWRRYPEEMLARLRYLREGRAVGFTIRELRDLLRLSVAGAPRFCESFDEAARRKIDSIDQVMGRLAAQRARLEEFSRGCRERRSEHRCPILENLSPRPSLSSRLASPSR
ncbi:MAG: MerR family transcriptional regulator [Steroidobacteraceae bacterium]